MDHDPFKPPASRVEVADTKRGSAVKAVMVGLAVDVGGSMLVGGLAMAAYGVYLGATGSTPDEAAGVAATFSYDSPLGIALAMIGCLFSVLGGFVCARIANHAEYRLGAIMCAISIVLSLAMGYQEGQGLVTAILIVLTLVAIMLGSHLGARKNRSGA
jgi:hypothetical protein